MVELHSERLILKALSDQDIPDLFDYFSDKGNFPYVQMQVYQNTDEVKNYLLKMQMGIDVGKWYLWGIFLKEVLIGTISLWNFSQDKKTAEFGYGLFPKFRGCGYMQEALKRCITYGDDVLKMTKFEAYTQEMNEPSVALLKKMGFEYQKTVIEDGEKMVVYTIKTS